ncbi:hypothetical protein AURDEDRAFT_187689 [Auricularia subglabra TFB-10046 SS5]|nr:hypothetical protein AURDEDRAFT_187689 [Auricularia subglabra TFB-10046 SS5]
MESTCEVFLAPRALPGQPGVTITRTTDGVLFAGVACNCPPGGPCRTHTSQELLIRARDHHARVAPRVPCTFVMSAGAAPYDRPLRAGMVLLQQAPSNSPYAQAAEEWPVTADQSKVVIDTLEAVYMPPCALGAGNTLNVFMQGFKVDSVVYR